jgi:hypothetical protein
MSGAAAAAAKEVIAATNSELSPKEAEQLVMAWGDAVIIEAIRRLKTRANVRSRSGVLRTILNRDGEEIRAAIEKRADERQRAKEAELAARQEAAKRRKEEELLAAARATWAQMSPTDQQRLIRSEAERCDDSERRKVLRGWSKATPPFEVITRIRDEKA